MPSHTSILPYYGLRSIKRRKIDKREKSGEEKMVSWNSGDTLNEVI